MGDHDDHLNKHSYADGCKSNRTDRLADRADQALRPFSHPSNGSANLGRFR